MTTTRHTGRLMLTDGPRVVPHATHFRKSAGGQLRLQVRDLTTGVMVWDATTTTENTADAYREMLAEFLAAREVLASC